MLFIIVFEVHCPGHIDSDLKIDLKCRSGLGETLDCIIYEFQCSYSYEVEVFITVEERRVNERLVSHFFPFSSTEKPEESKEDPPSNSGE